jgi:hypothetical protein
MTLAPRRTLALVALVIAAAALVVVAGRAGDARSASIDCPSFHVLHNDRIGSLRLPKGYYDVTANGMTCDAASERFTAFLEDWDGRLPRPWRFTARGAGRATFTGGRDSFAVKFSGPSPSGGHSAGGGSTRGLTCRAPFHVLGNDQIGALSVRAGYYRIVRLSTYSVSCTRASRLFTQFLQDFDGDLPGGWVLVPDEAGFIKGSFYQGFRIEPWSGPRPPHPTPGPSRCPGTFQVLHDDVIGPLAFPAGQYRLGILRGSQGLTCSGISSLFRQFLDDPSGRLPSPWVIDPETGMFRQGAGSRTGFSAKPAFDVP